MKGFTEGTLFSVRRVLLEKPQTRRFSVQLFGLRYYAAELGRWISRDPIWETGGIQLYCFAGSNAVNWIDPLGEKWKEWLVQVFVFIITGEGPPPPPPDPPPPSPPPKEAPAIPGPPQPPNADENDTTEYAGTLNWQVCAVTAGGAILAIGTLVTLNLVAPHIGVPATATVIFFMLTLSAVDTGQICCPGEM